MCSDVQLGLGMESHHYSPAVYTADRIEKAFRYSWPSAIMKDALYYSFMFELEVDEDQIMKKFKGRRSNDGCEILAPPSAIFRKVLCFYNRCIGKGYPRNRDPRMEHELVPALFKEHWALVEKQLVREPC